MCKIFFVLSVLLTLSSAAKQVINTPNGLNVYDLIEWSGIINLEKVPSTLYIVSPYNSSQTYSVMKMEIQGFRNRLAFSAGITGNETERRPKAHCELGKVRVAPGMRFRVIVRVMPRDILVYWNGELVFTMSLTSVFQPISRVRKVVYLKSAYTETFKLLSDEDLAAELNEPECGTVTHGITVPSFCPSPERNCQIAGGGPARPGQQPWQAAIRLKHDGGEAGSHVCGATLINGCWAVTAAHCFNSLSGRSLDGFVVRVGDYYNRDNETHSRDQTVENSVDLEIESLIRHRDYQTYPSPQNDITLIKLKKCVTYNNFVKPACLPRSVDQFSRSGSVCGVSGWGASNESQHHSEYPACLQSSLVRMRDSSFCNNTYQELFDSRNMICASASGCADTCDGDSGGPLMCISSGQSKYTLWGVTSWGVGCGDISRPGVYTKVSNYIRWIYTTIKLSPSHQTLIDMLSLRTHDDYNCVI